MKKIKKAVVLSVSFIVAFQLSGAFNVLHVFAEEDFSAPQNQIENNNLEDFQSQNSDALEEGATENISGSDLSSGQNNIGTQEENTSPTLPVENSADINSLGGNTKILPEVGERKIQPKSSPKTATLSISSTPNIVINEFMANPEGSDSGNEWIELYNKSDNSVNLSGWKLGEESDPDGWTLGSIIIQPHDFYIYHISGSHLNNSPAAGKDHADAVFLSLPDETSVDSHIYDIAHDGKSWGRYPDGSDHWEEFNHPTPGSTNYLKPIAGTVNDGPDVGIDIDYSNDNTQLSANWSGFSPSDDINHYEFAFGTANDGSDIIDSDWISTFETSGNKSMLLTEGVTYYASVRAISDDDIASDRAISDGVTIDTIAPINYDYVIFSEDGSPLTSGSEIYLEIQPGEADLLVNGTFNSKNLSWQMDIDQLKHGPFYFAIYKVEENDLQNKNAQLEFTLTDRAGNISQIYQFDSNVEIDTIAPFAPGSISVISGSDNIKINWAESISEDIAGYNIYRSSSPYVKLNQNLLPKSQVSYYDNDVEVGHQYQYKITAVDFAGNETDLASGTVSQAISLTSVVKVVGQILESGIKTQAKEIAVQTPKSSSSGEVKGESVAKETAPKEESAKSQDENENSKNWPMIIAIIISGLIIIAGIWYWWIASHQLDSNSSAMRGVSRRKSIKKISGSKRTPRRPSGRGKRRKR